MVVVAANVGWKGGGCSDVNGLRNVRRKEKEEAAVRNVCIFEDFNDFGDGMD